MLMGSHRIQNILLQPRKEGQTMYDNYMRHCRRLDPPADHEGDCLEIIKVRSEILRSKQLVIGGTYRMYYDRYGKVSEIADM